MATTSEPHAAASPTADRELVFTRLFDAPRETVFAAWTDPDQIARWWGPRGFSLTTKSMDLKPGGVWRFTMHGPDGQDYENRVTYSEVVRPERLVYKHGGAGDTEPVNFQVTVTFEEAGAGRTTLTMRSLFPSAAARDFVVKTYGADVGGRQTLDRLGEHLASLTDGAPAAHDFVISHVLRAPRDVAWDAWTQRDRLMAWFGPRGVTMPRSALDLKPGGVFHYLLRTPDGNDIWGKWVFREIVPRERMVFVSSFSDENVGVTRHPMAPDWPRELLTTVTFEDHAGKGRGTVVTVRWSVLNPTEAERRTFGAGMESMRNGWGGTFERLEEYLAGRR